VIGEVVKHGKTKKVIIYKYKPRKHSRKKLGHRQGYTEVKIKEIKLGDGANLNQESSSE